MNRQPEPADDVWRALAHPVRREILDLLREGPRTTGVLVEQLQLGRHVVVQHLGVLREADLVLVERRGRQRVNYLNPVPLQQILHRWLSRYDENWVAALVGLKETVERRHDQPAAREERNVG